MSTTPAGWYDDPHNPEQLRWWDGTTWGEQTSPKEGAGAVPAATATAVATGAAPSHSSDPRYAHDQFVVRQWFRIGVNKYEVHVGTGAGPHFDVGDLVVYVQQKRLALKEKVTYYADTGKTQPLLELKAQKRMNFRGKHDLTDLTTGQVVGQLTRKFGASTFVTSTWEIYDSAESHVLTITETSLPMALLRRYGPDLLNFFPFDMTLAYGPDSGKLGATPGVVIGHLKRRWGLKDVYDLNVSGDAQRLIDRRLIVAASIALDTLEGR